MNWNKNDSEQKIFGRFRITFGELGDHGIQQTELIDSKTTGSNEQTETSKYNNIEEEIESHENQPESEEVDDEIVSTLRRSQHQNTLKIIYYLLKKKKEEEDV